MAIKRVFNKEELAKTKAIKGQVRSEMGMAGIKALSAVHVDKKRKAKSSTRNEKHKTRYL